MCIRTETKPRIMSVIYLFIVIFLLFLALTGLFVGVSNDAVNFLQSAIGSRVAKFRTVLIVASAGVILGALLSSGMMDLARHGIMVPTYYSFEEVMTVFLAVMVINVLVLDGFNTLGMPTSSTVSLVFALLGGTFVVGFIKMLADPNLTMNMVIHSDKALGMIIAIFVSVAIAFVFGCIVMWISRVVFTFNYKSHSRYSIAVFGGIAFTALAYFIFLKGLGGSPYLSDSLRAYIGTHTPQLLLWTFLASTVLMEGLYLLKVNIFKVIVMMGTFALAMAFAGNDLVNFIGVPLAGLDSYLDYTANAGGAAPSDYLMGSLMQSATTSPLYLLAAGIVMIVAMATSKKAQNVVKTSVDLSRQDEGDEMFGSSRAARAIVRYTQNANDRAKEWLPAGFRRTLDKRFNKQEIILEDDTAAFDLVRAAVNLVIAAMLITIGTNYRLPLSTTYVTFMVAMGSSLVDRAWSRESAVFRVTGVLSVIGGWFITAGVAFVGGALVAAVMHFGGLVVQLFFIVIVIYSLVKSNKRYAKKELHANREKSAFRLIMRTRDPELVWEMLRKQVSRTQSFVNRFALEEYNKIMEGFMQRQVSKLRQVTHELKNEQEELKKYRKQELLGLKRCPIEVAIERNTWFHVGANSNQQFIYCLIRMLEPIKEHVDNNFNPLPPELVEELQTLRQRVESLMKAACNEIEANRYEAYRDILHEADMCKDDLSIIRHRHIDRIQRSDNSHLQVNLLYLNVLQETQEFLSVMRHQLRAAKKFNEQ